MNKTLRQLRNDSLLKTNEILYHMNIQSSTLYSWESGARLIPIDKLYQLLKLYDCPIKDFDFDGLIQTHKDKEQVKMNA